LRKAGVILLVLLFPIVFAAAQQPVKPVRNLRLETLVHYGFVIPHHKTMQHLTQSHFPCFEVNLSEQTHGKQIWEQLFKYPLKGLGLYYSPLGNTRELGHALAVYPYINFCLTHGKKVNLYFRVAAGLGYLTKSFDAETNYKNIAIGSHFNAFIQLRYELRWHITDRLGFSAGISISHFSNACYKVPNFGINIPTLNMGLSYRLNKTPAAIIKNEIPAADKKWQFSIMGSFGLNELAGPGGRKYPYYCLSGFFMKPASLKRQFGIGLDVYYSEALGTLIQRSDSVSNIKYQAIRPGLSFAYIMNFARLSFVAQLGAYLYTKEKTDGYIWDRVALRYTVKDHYLFQMGLKTHLSRAEVLELSVGYKF